MPEKKEKNKIQKMALVQHVKSLEMMGSLPMHNIISTNKKEIENQNIPLTSN
jgi:hypothetical protein